MTNHTVFWHKIAEEDYPVNFEDPMGNTTIWGWREDLGIEISEYSPIDGFENDYTFWAYWVNGVGFPTAPTKEEQE